MSKKTVPMNTEARPNLTPKKKAQAIHQQFSGLPVGGKKRIVAKVGPDARKGKGK